MKSDLSSRFQIPENGRAIGKIEIDFGSAIQDVKDHHLVLVVPQMLQCGHHGIYVASLIQQIAKDDDQRTPYNEKFIQILQRTLEKQQGNCPRNSSIGITGVSLGLKKKKTKKSRPKPLLDGKLPSLDGSENTNNQGQVLIPRIDNPPPTGSPHRGSLRITVQ